MSPVDAALLKRWTDYRDAEAFNDLVSRHADLVYATCKRILGNSTDAEDVAQECFLKLATSGARVRTSLGGWLHSVATSLAINRIRSEARRRAREHTAANEAPTATDSQRDDIQRYVDEAISGLPEKLRDPLVRHFLQRQTHDEIARDLGLTRSAVTKRIGAGVERLRATLRRNGVTVAATALAALVAEHAAEAAPATLTANLGRLALSGVAKPAAMSGAVSAMALVKIALTVTAIVAICAATIMGYNHATQVSARRSAEPSTSDVAGGLPSAKGKRASDTNAETDRRQNATPTIKQAANPATDSAAALPAISGRVYDVETQQGIAAAEVQLIAGRSRVTFSTDEKGEYHVDSAPTGTCEIGCVEANGYYIGSEKRPTETPGLYRPVTIAPSKPLTGVDFPMSRGQRFHGRVVDTNNRPVANAPVTGQTKINQTWVTNTTESKDDGSFVLSGFPPTVSLFAWAERGALVSDTGGPYALPQIGDTDVPLVMYPEAVVRGVVQDQRGKPLPGLKVMPQFPQDEAGRTKEATSDTNGQFELRGMFPGYSSIQVCRGVKTVNAPVPTLTLTAGQRVDDLVLKCSVGSLSISGAVVDSHGKGMSITDVRCYDVEDEDKYSHALTNERGEFAMDALEPGLYRLVATRVRFIQSKPLEIPAGSSNVRLILTDPASIDGRVVDAVTKKPIPMYEVKLCTLPDELIFDQGYEKASGKDGTFRIGVDQLGTLCVVARAEGYLLGYANVTVDQSKPAIHSIEIELKPQKDLHGVVHDQTGKPLAGALIFSGEVHEHDADTLASARTGSDGTFILPARKLGHGAIVVYHPAYPRAEVSLEPKHYAGESIDVLVRAGTLLVCTVSCNGAPYDGAQLYATRLSPHSQSPGTSGKTGPDGVCRFETLTPGDYIVQAALPAVPPNQSDAQISKQTTVEAGKTTELGMELSSGNAMVSGRLEGARGWMRLGLSITTEQGAQRYVIDDVDGKAPKQAYVFSNLPAGEAFLKVTWGATVGAGPNQSIRHTLKITPGATIEQNLELGKGVALSGTVGPLANQERAQVIVLYGHVSLDDWVNVAYDFDRDFCANAPVTEDGSFRLDGVQPGTYTLIAQAFAPNQRPQDIPRRAITNIDLKDPGKEVTLRFSN